MSSDDQRPIARTNKNEVGRKERLRPRKKRNETVSKGEWKVCCGGGGESRKKRLKLNRSYAVGAAQEAVLTEA